MKATAPITAFIVDDEPLARRHLRRLITQEPWLACVGEAASAGAAIAAIDALQPDLAFLDIRLPGLSGIDVLGQLQHVPAVIFTTAYDQFAVTAFEVGALDYLLKPFGRERFTRALTRARPFLDKHAGASTVERAREVLDDGRMTRLFVRDGGRIVPVPLAAIERFEACDDYVVMHSGKMSFTVNLTMADLEGRLDPRVFVRVHRSHIVNLDHLVSLTPDGARFQITLRSGHTVMASRERSRMLRSLGR